MCGLNCFCTTISCYNLIPFYQDFIVLNLHRLGTRVLKKKKLKIDPRKPLGNKIDFDDDGDAHDPLSALAAANVDDLKFNQGILLFFLVDNVSLHILLYLRIISITMSSIHKR